MQRARKFSAVFGTTSASNSMTILPAGCPPMEMSKKTCGFPIFLRRITLRLPRAKRKRFGKSTGLMTCLILPQRIVGNFLHFRLDPPSMRKQSESRGVENRLICDQKTLVFSFYLVSLIASVHLNQEILVFNF